MDRADLVSAALGMVGTPFHAQGRMPGVGLDCIGLVVCAARQAGYEPQDRAAYPLRPDGTLRPALEAQLTKVTGKPNCGDILLMSFDGAEPHHVAIYVGDEQIVHAYAQARRVAKQMFTQFWKSKVVAIYQFPEVK